MMVRAEGHEIRLAANDDTDFKHRAVSAVSEAFNNVVLHAYKGRSGVVKIEIDVSAPEEMVVRIIDNGEVFDPTAVPLPNLEELPERGMGLYLMRACMDEVAYGPGPPNVLWLRRRRGVAESDPSPLASGASASEDRTSGMLTVGEAYDVGNPDDQASEGGAPTRASGRSDFRMRSVPPPSRASGHPRRP